MTLRARARRWWARHVQRCHGETCQKCGRRVGVFWLVPDEVWKAVTGGDGRVLCVLCFNGMSPFAMQWTATLLDPRVDVRVPTAQRSHADAALNGIAYTVNEHPPASGPEIEISTVGHTADEIERRLEHWGVSVLAIREIRARG